MPGPTPSLTIQTAGRQGDGRSNQDTIITGSRSAAVLDGATAWLAQLPGRDGGWYSRSLAARLLPRLDENADLADILADAIESVAGEYSLDAGPSCPESTVTIARWDDQELELLVLGDSPAVIFGPDPEPIVILDDRLEPAGAKARRAYQEHLRGGAGYGPPLDALLAKLQRDEIVLRNQDGGYWTAETDPAAAKNAITRRFRIDDVSAVLLLSDGASAGVLGYGRPATWADALADIRARGPGSFVDAVHQTEDTDPDGQRWPRSKCHDDKALVVISR